MEVLSLRCYGVCRLGIRPWQRLAEYVETTHLTVRFPSVVPFQTQNCLCLVLSLLTFPLSEGLRMRPFETAHANGWHGPFSAVYAS